MCAFKYNENAIIINCDFLDLIYNNFKKKKQKALSFSCFYSGLKL